MAKKVLLAVRPQEADAFYSLIQRSSHAAISTSSLTGARTWLGKMLFHIAVVDEDFDGPGTGWILAKHIRQQLPPDVKIVMLVRSCPQEYFENKELAGRFDWIMAFPISGEQLLHELDRKWPTTS